MKRVLLIGLTCSVLLGCDRCSGPKETAAVPPPANPAAEQPQGDLKIEDVKVGTGAEAVEGKKVWVQYTGTTTDGVVFDSTRGRADPLTFVVGSDLVIPGMNRGVKGMKVGGQRKLVVPPGLAYGSRSVGGAIKPNATLLFDVELVKVE